MTSARSSSNVPQSRPLLSIPAVRAALIQALAFLIVLATMFALPAIANAQLSILGAVLLQGASAMLITRKWRLAFWWLPIQGLFPVALAGALSLHLPPLIFFALFAALLALYWSTFRTQVPFYPSGLATWNAVLAELPRTPIQFVDIGSGLGGLTLHLADARPESKFTGVELAPLPWLVSVVRNRLRGSVASFVRVDYEQLNLAMHDVAFAYLSPAAMPSLWEKARAEMRPGAVLFSYEFDIPGIEPHFVRMPTQDGPALYGWRL